jgi:ferrous iron transport protein B
MLAAIAGVLAHAFKPLGFGNWEAATAVLSGFTAKEAVVSTMAVVYNVSKDGLPAHLAQHFTTASALSFTVFNLLCMPCVAAVSSIRQELGNMKWTLAALGYQTGIAWIFALAVYMVAEVFHI